MEGCKKESERKDRCTETVCLSDCDVSEKWRDEKNNSKCGTEKRVE